MECHSEGEGPDGSSIRPVSSLRARFENLNTTPDAPHQTTSLPPSRPISPGPKPEKLRNFKPKQEPAPAVPSTTPSVPARPKERPKPSRIITDGGREPTPPPPPDPSTRPPISTPKLPSPSSQTPSVTVQPPLSPPKARVSAHSAVDQSPYLNPDAVAVAPPTSNGSPQPRTPTRTRTPTPALPPPRSPRSVSSQPPSPPPPRRSGELRRERETKVPPPVPAPRLDKGGTLLRTQNLPAAREVDGRDWSRREDISQETSPFSSPPGSPKTDGDEAPPELPTRPRPRPKSHIETATRPKSLVGGFEPPPVHHSVAVRRVDRDSEANSVIKPVAHHQPQPREARPDLPLRSQPQTSQQRPLQTNHTMKPPPRPARGAIHGAVPASTTTPGTSPPKRVTSNPTHDKQMAPPPARTHGRSMTVGSPTVSSQPVDDRSHTAANPPTAKPTTSKAPTSSAKDVTAHVTAYPNGSNTNRRPPFVRKSCYEIPTRYDPRVFDVCGDLVCASGSLTRLWSVSDGELLMSLSHTENVKATSVAFKPAADPQEEGSKIWIGLNTGELMEVDVATHSMTPSKPNVHGRFEVIKIHRHFNELWTLDEAGTLHVWGPDENDVPNLSGSPTQSYKVPKAHTFSMVVHDELWHATGKEVRVFAPTLAGRQQFQVLIRPLIADGAGDVTAGTMTRSQPDKVFLGHVDGKVSVYSTTDYSCTGVLSISTWKINGLSGVGNDIWAAYNTGKVCVYDVEESPWVVKKEWQAHDNPVAKMKMDSASCYQLDRSHVLTLGADNRIRIWDGMLQEDWLEDDMKAKDTEYCAFDELRAMVLTWNAGASTPHSLRYSGDDGAFFQELVQSSGSPDILIFGFQELVDLEDKKATAKRFLKPKKKEGTDQERMSHQYRDWRDFLLKTLDDYMPADDLYHLLHTAPLVGLFTCVFVKSSLRARVRNLNGAEVKRGMGGYHGNKGAVAVRFKVDDTSLCFVNCHLAAGQTQASSRHHDVAAILESSLFPAEKDPDARLDSFTGGGDGTMILDHELCVLNGDLNYRIDTMSRDTVVTAVKHNNLTKLLDRDQLLVARRRNPTFKLRAFDEMPITFAPTYKYDVGTDNYDTSEKRRSPAWCDRILYRGRGRIQQIDYKRHEVRVSDHRPVTASLRFWVKKVDEKERASAWLRSQQKFENIRQREMAADKLAYLTQTCGFDQETSLQLLNGTFR